MCRERLPRFCVVLIDLLDSFFSGGQTMVGVGVGGDPVELEHKGVQNVVTADDDLRVCRRRLSRALLNYSSQSANNAQSKHSEVGPCLRVVGNEARKRKYREQEMTSEDWRVQAGEGRRAGCRLAGVTPLTCCMNVMNNLIPSISMERWERPRSDVTPQLWLALFFNAQLSNISNPRPTRRDQSENWNHFESCIKCVF